MNRYLFRVQYTHPDDTVSYEPVCVRALTEAAAETEIDEATERFPTVFGATKTLTLVLTTADV